MTTVANLYLKCSFQSNLLVVLYLVVCIHWSEALVNTSQGLQHMDEEQLMKGRFFGTKDKQSHKFLTFETRDEAISVEMTFGVPFLSIPLKKDAEIKNGFLSSLPSVNVNTGALALSLGVALGAIYMSPLVGKLFRKSSDSGDFKKKDIGYERSFSESIFEMLDEQEVPIQYCIQRAICTLVKKAVESKTPSSTDKIIDGIISNEWLMTKLKDTMISDAVMAGSDLKECSRKYIKCKINQRSLQTISNFLTNFIFNNNL